MDAAKRAVMNDQTVVCVCVKGIFNHLIYIIIYLLSYGICGCECGVFKIFRSSTTIYITYEYVYDLYIIKNISGKLYMVTYTGFHY